MKICTKCSTQKPFTEFVKDTSRKDNFSIYCKSCRNEKKRNWSQNNKQKMAEYDKKWQQNNKDKKAINYRNWQLNNKNKANSYNSYVRAAKLKRTPAWANIVKIQAYYDVCAFFNEINGYIKYHVDHIIPLQGKTVSGLHVENNLQVLLAKDNMSKGNRYD